jgi:chitin disaccharide deacetylase
MNLSQNIGTGACGGESKPIMLCADDFGMSREINAGIIELASNGFLSAVSCMSGRGSFNQDAQNLAELSVEKGLHLNLTESFDGTEYYRPLHRLILNCFARRIDPKVIQIEIEKQLDIFEDSFGRGPDFVDGHQHVHQFPVVRECLVKILLRRYRGRLPWIRSTFHAKQSDISANVWMKAVFIEALGGRSLRKMAARYGFKMNSHLLGVYGFDGGEDRYMRLFDAWIRSAGPNDLIMCHPAKGIDIRDPLGPQRCAEFAVLVGPLFQSMLQRHGAFVAKSLNPANSTATPVDTMLTGR